MTLITKKEILSSKKLLLEKLIHKIAIPNADKEIFLSALFIVPDSRIEKLYNEITYFVQDLEIKDISEIEKSNFIHLGGMTIKQAEQKREEINACNFLLTNI